MVCKADAKMMQTANWVALSIARLSFAGPIVTGTNVAALNVAR